MELWFHLSVPSKHRHDKIACSRLEIYPVQMLPSQKRHGIPIANRGPDVPIVPNTFSQSRQYPPGNGSNLPTDATLGTCNALATSNSSEIYLIDQRLAATSCHFSWFCLKRCRDCCSGVDWGRVPRCDGAKAIGHRSNAREGPRIFFLLDFFPWSVPSH